MLSEWLEFNKDLSKHGLPKELKRMFASADHALAKMGGRKLSSLALYPKDYDELAAWLVKASEGKVTMEQATWRGIPLKRIGS